MCLFLMYFETHLIDFILWLFWRLSGFFKASIVRGSANGSLGLFLLSLRLGLEGPWRLLFWTLSSSPGRFWTMTKIHSTEIEQHIALKIEVMVAAFAFLCPLDVDCLRRKAKIPPREEGHSSTKEGQPKTLGSTPTPRPPPQRREGSPAPLEENGEGHHP